jgi:hypothetical protein
LPAPAHADFRLLNQRFVTRQLPGHVGQHGASLHKLGTAPLAQLARMRQRLLSASNFSALGVIAALHRVHPLAGGELEFALLFDSGFSGALPGSVLLQLEIGIAHGAIIDRCPAVNFTQTQRDDFSR